MLTLEDQLKQINLSLTSKLEAEVFDDEISHLKQIVTVLSKEHDEKVPMILTQ